MKFVIKSWSYSLLVYISSLCDSFKKLNSGIIKIEKVLTNLFSDLLFKIIIYIIFK